MKELPEISLSNVQEVYSGPEGRLWELVMGEQIHIGGLSSSLELSQKAGIEQGTRGVDLCCCTGAGMRFLLRFCEVEHMTGVDATERMVKLGERRSEKEGLSGRTEFVLAPATETGLPAGSADFVWGEDAWCYVEDKDALLAEAARLVKPGGTVAFTDWVEGPAGLADDEAERFMRFMKFPSLCAIGDYEELLTRHGCRVELAEDTGLFGRYIDLYINMLNMQLAYDALKLIGFDMDLMQAMSDEMSFMQDLARAKKIAQAAFVARK